MSEIQNAGSYDLVSNELLPGWPDKKREDYEKASKAMQGTESYYGCLGSECISFRRMIHDARGKVVHIESHSGQLARTIPWCSTACPKDLLDEKNPHKVQVKVTIRYEGWRKDSLGFSRYAYISVEEIK